MNAIDSFSNTTLLPIPNPNDSETVRVISPLRALYEADTGVKYLFGPDAPTLNVIVVSVTAVRGIERTEYGSIPTLGYDLTDWLSSISQVNANDSDTIMIPSPTLKLWLATVTTKSPVAGS